MISLTSPVETWAHHWPAGLKLALLCVSTVALFSQTSVAFHLAAFAVCIGLYLLPGAHFAGPGLRRLWGLWPFVAMLVVWHAVTGDLSGGLVVVLRLLTAVALANLVTMTTRLSQMIDVVRWLSTPLRVLGLNTRALELGIALVIRFTPALADKGGLLVQSWSARSPRKPNWKIIVPFTVLAIDDAEQVAEAIKARGGL